MIALRTYRGLEVWAIGQLRIVTQQGHIKYVDHIIDIDERIVNIGRNKKRWGK